MLISLETFLKYDDISILCHNAPDADTLASAYGLWKFFADNGKRTEIIYGGPASIERMNMKLLVQAMEGVEVKRVQKGYECKDLLISVDCQLGAGNVEKVTGKTTAIIDHHHRDPNIIEADYVCLLPTYSACSSIIYQMLCAAGYRVNRLDDEYRLSTLLYYGIYMDTCEFSELRNPGDRDACDKLKVNEDIFVPLQSNNMTISELQIIGQALSHCYYDKDSCFAIIEAPKCDPNILGLVADLVIRVANVDACVVYLRMETHGMYKISVRCMSKALNAASMARELTAGVGSGGGHQNKAGGVIYFEDFEKESVSQTFEQFLVMRYNKFRAGFDIINYKDLDIGESYAVYEKKPLVLGYVLTTDLDKLGESLCVHTLEGQVEVTVEDDVYLMIGIQGEAYPIDAKKFNELYSIDVPEGKPFDISSRQYRNMVSNLKTGDEITISDDMVRRCKARPYKIYARRLPHMAKILTKWDYKQCMMASTGDYLAVNFNDKSDIYSISGEMFEILYKKSEDQNHD